MRPVKKVHYKHNTLYGTYNCLHTASFMEIKLNNIYVGVASVLVTGMVFCTVASICTVVDKDRGICSVLAFTTHICLFVGSDQSFFSRMDMK